MSEENSEVEQKRPLPKLPMQWMKDRLCLHVIKDILEIVNRLKTWPKKEVNSLFGEITSSFENFLELLEEITLSSSKDILFDSAKDLKEQLEVICIEVEQLDLNRLKLLKSKLAECIKNEETRELSLDIASSASFSANSENNYFPSRYYYNDEVFLNFKSDPVPDPDFVIELKLWYLKRFSPDFLWTSKMWYQPQKSIKFFGRTNAEGELLKYCENAFPLARDLIHHQTGPSTSTEKERGTEYIKKLMKQKPHTSRKPY